MLEIQSRDIPFARGETALLFIDCSGNFSSPVSTLITRSWDRSYPITELWRLVAGLAPGRRDVRQITLFDSVGFAIEDFSALQYVREHVAETGFCEALDMIADPDDPRDLFGMLERARQNRPPRLP